MKTQHEQQSGIVHAPYSELQLEELETSGVRAGWEELELEELETFGAHCCKRERRIARIEKRLKKLKDCSCDWKEAEEAKGLFLLRYPLVALAFGVFCFFWEYQQDTRKKKAGFYQQTRFLSPSPTTFNNASCWEITYEHDWTSWKIVFGANLFYCIKKHFPTFVPW